VWKSDGHDADAKDVNNVSMNVRSPKLLFGLVITGLVVLTACGPSATPTSRSTTLASNRATNPALNRVAKDVSFTPVLPSVLPAGYAFQSVQVNRPPTSSPHEKQLTMLVLTFTGHGQRFQLTETAMHVTVSSATAGPLVAGQPMHLAAQVNNGVHVITAEIRLDGVTYILDSPGSLSLAEAERVLASVAH
jgi:hypothetical protein